MSIHVIVIINMMTHFQKVSPCYAICYKHWRRYWCPYYTHQI